jgi:hypothetical protein
MNPIEYNKKGMLLTVDGGQYRPIISFNGFKSHYSVLVAM